MTPLRSRGKEEEREGGETGEPWKRGRDEWGRREAEEEGDWEKQGKRGKRQKIGRDKQGRGKLRSRGKNERFFFAGIFF